MAAIEYTGKVLKNQFITPTVFQLEFETTQPIEFKAGQFASMVIPGAGPGGRDLRRAYSIASPPHESKIQLCIQVVEGGPGTSYLKKLREGDPIKCVAPYGEFIFKPKPNLNAYFIATGTGISPFRSIMGSADFLSSTPKSVTCLFGTRTEADILYADALSKTRLNNGLGVEFKTCLSKAETTWKGFKGRVTDALRAQEATIPWLETDFYLCGNGAMIKEIKALLTEKGVPKEQLHLEVYYHPKATEAMKGPGGSPTP